MNFTWKFFPGHDVPGHDICNYGARSPEDLMNAARDLEGCIAFNTNGWMKRSAQGLSKSSAFDGGGGVYIKVEESREEILLTKLLTESHSRFMDMFQVSEIEGVSLQKIGESDLFLARDDEFLKYDKIISLNYKNNFNIEKDLCKIFVKNFILSTLHVNVPEDIHNLVIGQIDEELVRSLNKREAMFKKKTPTKTLLISNTSVEQFQLERHIIQSLLQSTANISQLILNVHNICLGNEKQIEGLFAMLQYLTQDMIIVNFKTFDQVKIGVVAYPKHISITFINRDIYEDKKIKPFIQFV